MKKSIAVIGLGRFGLSLIEELSKHDVDIMALDNSEENVAKAADLVSNAFICDATNESSMNEIGIKNVDHAVIAFGSNIQATILTLIILKEMNIEKITVRVDNEYYVKVIKKLGATEVILPQKIAGIRLANKIISDTFIDYYNLSSEYVIVEISVGPNVSPLNIQEINPRNKFDVNLLLIQREDKVFSPKGTDDILPNDFIFVFGHVTKISIFDRFINQVTKK